MSEYTFWDKFLVSDNRTLELMKDFPMHKFRSNPVAYVPMGGGTRGGLVAVVYKDGTIAALKPTLHDVVEIDAKENDDTQEQFLAAGVAVYDGELAVAIWDSTSQSYRVNLYRVEKYSLKRVGSAPLAPPRTGEVLCGFAHTGGRLMCVWVDGSLQIYGPNADGLSLLQSYKLGGFDFGVMKKKSGTEDLRSLPVEISVCASIGSRDVVVVAGPCAGRKGLKYVVVDTRTGMAQSSGVLYDNIEVQAPVKLIVVDAAAGKIRGVVGGQDLGEQVVAAKSNTLAARLGANSGKPFSRKRKYDSKMDGVSPAKHIRVDRQCDLIPEAPSNRHRSVTFSLPPWAKLLCEAPQMARAILSSTPIVEKMPVESFTASPPKKNGVLREAMISKFVTDLMESFSSTSKQDPGLIDRSINVLKDCKEMDVTLTVDLVGVTAGAIADTKNSWGKLETLIKIYPIRSLTHCPNLLAELIKSSKFGLFESVLRSVEVLGVEELKGALHAIFDSESDPDQMKCQIDHYDRMQSSALASVSGAENQDAKGLKKLFAKVEREVALVEGFSQTEILLHPILRTSSDALCLSEALCGLSSTEAGKLLSYLGKWFKKHVRFHPMGSEEEWILCKVPDRNSVVDWLNTLVSCQISVLSGREKEQEVAKELLDSITKWKKIIEAGLGCRALLESMLQKEKMLGSGEGGLYRITPFDLGVAGAQI